MKGAATNRVRLLGPVEVLVEGRLVVPDRLQIRRVLALIAARPGQAISTDELVDQLWTDGLPADPRRTLQGYVARIPRCGSDGSSLVHSKRSGYWIEPDLIDVWHFHDLLHRAAEAENTSEAIAHLEGIQALWRGAPFIDAAGPELLTQVAAQLDEMRVLAHCSLAELLVANGESGRAVVLVQQDFADAPDNERLGLVLAGALAHEGRRTEALAVLDRVRGALLDIGLSPTAELLSLEHDILHGGIDLRVVSSAGQAEANLPFVGRAEAIEQLVESCRAAQSSLLVGEAGLGKTTLLEHLDERLSDVGLQRLRYRVDPDPAKPLAFIAELITDLRDRRSDVATEAERLAIARLVPDGTAGDEGSAHLGRDEFAAALVAFIARSIAASRVVLEVDDIQQLDPFSATILANVMTNERCCVVGTCRLVEQVLSLAPFDTSHGLSIVRLEPLTTQEVATYVEARYRRARQTPRSAELRRRTGGNPLFLRLLVDLDTEGALEGRSLPPSILLAIRGRLDSLARRTVETLQIAASIGTRFTLSTLEAVRQGCSQDLEDAVRAQLIAVDLQRGEGEFVHGLVAKAVYDMLPEGKRAEVHDRIGQASVSLGVQPTGVARHFVLAAPLDPLRAIEACIAAADDHSERHALEVARRLLLEARRLCDEYNLATTTSSAEVLVALGRVQRLASDSEHVDTLLRGAELARRLGAHDVFASAVIELSSHGGTTRAGRSDERVLELVSVALESPLSEASRAVLSASVSTLTSLTPEYRRGQELFAEALDMVERLGDPIVEAQVLVHAHLGLSDPEDLNLRHDAARRLSAVAGADIDLRWEAEYLWIWHHLIHAYPREVAGSLDRLRTLTPRARHRRLALGHLEAAVAQVRGDPDTAESLLADTAALTRSMFSESWAMAHQASLLFSIRDAQGRVAEVADQVEAFVAAAPDFPNWRSALALVSIEVGDDERAQSIVDDLVADRGRALFRDITWTASVGVLGRVASRLGDVDSARVLYDMLAPFGGLMSWAGTCSFGPNDLALGQLAVTLGDERAAERHHRVAEAMTDRMQRGGDDITSNDVGPRS